MTTLLISLITASVFLTFVAIGAERLLRQSTWGDSCTQGGRDLCLFSMGLMAGLIFANHSLEWMAHVIGYLYMGLAATLALLMAYIRQLAWKTVTVASWSLGLGFVAVSLPLLWLQAYEATFSPVISQILEIGR